jgi:predicted acetyltransferase
VTVDFEMRSLSPGDLQAYLEATSAAFGARLRPHDVEAVRPLMEYERSMAAFDGKDIVGVNAVSTFQMTVPGAIVPTGGVATVATLPTHRRRGVMTALMGQQLDDMHERGEPLAALWASEAAIYGRFGFGAATTACSFDIQRHHTAFAGPVRPEGRIRLVDLEEALKTFPPVHDRVLPGRPGMIERNEAWWRYRLTEDVGSEEEGPFVPFFAVYEAGGSAHGYVAYAVRHEHASDGTPANVVGVEELVAATDDAYAALWRYCFDLDLSERIMAANRPPDEPLLYMLAEPRRLAFKVSDGMWVRVVDVPAALGARMYAAGGRLVLEVRDSVCPWNDGRFVLEGGPGVAICEPTSDQPDLVLAAADLGAAYLGGASFRTLAAAGRVVELRDGALATATAMFAWDPAPWCPYMF